MENVLPGALQRLRASDIIRMAGLTAASLGQEYCRAGAVHTTQRHGARVTGIVDIPRAPSNLASVVAGDEDMVPAVPQLRVHHYPVEVEMTGSTSWVSSCPCDHDEALLCLHAAALLYQWLAHPGSFALSSSAPTAREEMDGGAPERAASAMAHVAVPLATSGAGVPASSSLPGALQRSHPGPAPLGDLSSILTQLGLSELRGIAREYEVVTNGMSRPQLAETILACLQQQELVRRVAATLEKTPRQLLAAITLAGGTITDDDLRGLFERFALGQPGQLQSILVTLQGKGLLFRASLNNTTQQRSTTGLSGTLLDIGWYVPLEVRTALRVSVPVTLFNVEQGDQKYAPPVLQSAAPFRVLADLLLVARALEGRSADSGEQDARRSPEHASFTRSTAFPSTDSSVAIPPPADMPAPSLLSSLGTHLSYAQPFLRFALRMLRLADIVHKDDNGTPYLRLLPHAAALLLGPSRAAVLRDLFELWLTRSSYAELFELQEENVRLRCRASSLNQPILRSGELEAENSEARQAIVTLLAQAPLNQWISFASFARFVYRLNPLFLQRRQRLFSSPHWWLEQEEGRHLRPLGLNDWQRAEMFYLAHLLSGPLHWWGACDVALSNDGHLLAFRLTPLAAWLFNGVPADEGGTAQDYQWSSDSLEVVESGEVLVTCSSHTWPIVQLLEIFMEAAGVHHDRLCYRLTPKALGEAMSRGHRPASLLNLLRHVVANAPQRSEPLLHMVAQLEQWIASYGRVRIYTGVTLLETADGVVMRELAATTSLDEQIVQTIHPTLLLLKKAGTERVIEDLKRRGQSPLLHDEEFYGPE